VSVRALRGGASSALLLDLAVEGEEQADPCGEEHQGGCDVQISVSCGGVHSPAFVEIDAAHT
jgi:hypothetical protein